MFITDTVRIQLQKGLGTISIAVTYLPLNFQENFIVGQNYLKF